MLYGNDVWKLCIEICWGYLVRNCSENTVWKSCVEIVYGSHVWKSCMEIVYGNLHGSWRPKLETKAGENDLMRE